MRATLLIAGICGLGISTSASAAIVYASDFEAGTRVNWFSALSNGSVSVINDGFAGGGSTKALQLSSPDTFRRMTLAQFPTSALAVGESITVSFDFRFTQAPANNSGAFRFGLYNNNGTLTSADNSNGVGQPTDQNDDFGYWARMGAGGAVGNQLFDEPTGDNPTGGGIGGTQLATSPGDTVTINDQLKHTMSLTILRSTATTNSLTLKLDGNTFTATDASSPYTTFNSLHFSKGNVTTDFAIDNVVVSTTLVPEPGLIGLAALGGLAMLRRRRA